MVLLALLLLVLTAVLLGTFSYRPGKARQELLLRVGGKIIANQGPSCLHILLWTACEAFGNTLEEWPAVYIQPKIWDGCGQALENTKKGQVLAKAAAAALFLIAAAKLGQVGAEPHAPFSVKAVLITL